MSFSPINPTATTGSAILASTFNITALSGVFVATGLTITLPQAGTYLVLAEVRATIQASSGSNAYIGLEFYNTTDAAVVAGSVRLGAYSFNAGVAFIGTTSIHKIVIVTASKTIALYASRNNGSAYSFSSVDQDQTEMSYIKLA